MAGIVLNPRMKQAVFRGSELDLYSSKSFELLYYLTAHAGILISREELMREVWKESVPVGPRMVDTGISRLRTSLKDSGILTPIIMTGRGGGYYIPLNLLHLNELNPNVDDASEKASLNKPNIGE